MKIQNFIGALLLFIICSSCRDNASDYSSVANKKTPKVVDYNFDIRPILSDKCFACHGPDANKREADLRLDTKEGAYAALKDHANKFAIVSGKPEESEVYLRITSLDSTQLMPP
ncbi:MAG: c-type cytochrome domain-containing protein, partial [Allomuricauda sp.]